MAGARTAAAGGLRWAVAALLILSAGGFPQWGSYYTPYPVPNFTPYPVPEGMQKSRGWTWYEETYYSKTSDMPHAVVFSTWGSHVYGDPPENDLMPSEDRSHDSHNLTTFLQDVASSETERSLLCDIPKVDPLELRELIKSMLEVPRNSNYDPELKEKAWKSILERFREIGLEAWEQNFIQEGGSEENIVNITGTNIVGMLPGARRGTADDGLLLVGAHYDTVSNTDGVNDNGSGVAVMLKIAESLSNSKCKFDNSMYFVAFDREEDGALGSQYFVNDYLIPRELDEGRGQFQGAFILDTVLNYNNSLDSQEIPDGFEEVLPTLDEFMKNEGYRGDFLAMFARTGIENRLAAEFIRQWEQISADHDYKLYTLAVNLKPGPEELEQAFQQHYNFLRSDHLRFWYPNITSPRPLSAVLLTDTGPFRGIMRQCYHKECDNASTITLDKLQFAKKTADVLTATLVELGGGEKALSSKLGGNIIICLFFVLCSKMLS